MLKGKLDWELRDPEPPIHLRSLVVASYARSTILSTFPFCLERRTLTFPADHHPVFRSGFHSPRRRFPIHYLQPVRSSMPGWLRSRLALQAHEKVHHSGSYGKAVASQSDKPAPYPNIYLWWIRDSWQRFNEFSSEDFLFLTALDNWQPPLKQPYDYVADPTKFPS